MDNQHFEVHRDLDKRLDEIEKKQVAVESLKADKEIVYAIKEDTKVTNELMKVMQKFMETISSEIKQQREDHISFKKEVKKELKDGMFWQNFLTEIKEKYPKVFNAAISIIVTAIAGIVILIYNYGLQQIGG